MSNRGIVDRYAAAFAGDDFETADALIHDDYVLEFPQSGERFVGIENFREWRGEYLVDGEARREQESWH